MIFLPVPLLFLIMFTLGIALLLAAGSVFFYDIIDGYQILLLPWMYLTPIIYPLEIIPDRFLPLIKLNPMYYLVECFRVPIYGGKLPGLEVILMSGAVAFLSLCLGYRVFTRLADDFIYYV